MKTIYRFPLNKTAEVNCIDVPEGAELLTLQLKDDCPNLWFLVDTKKPLVERRFFIVATGESLRPDLTREHYRGTFQAPGTSLGTLVFHVFETTP